MSEAFLVIDVQNDYCTGGALAVLNGEMIVQPINEAMDHFDLVLLTQDWHPQEHKSFASSHENKRPFDTVEMFYGDQVLWPDHCIQGSLGANFHPDLKDEKADVIIRKGSNPAVGSYSPFFDNDKVTPTGLHGYLKDCEVTDLMLAGLATDFCVAFSALDAAILGYQVTVSLDMVRAIDADGSLRSAMGKMSKAGVNLVNG
ncbi:MAG: bifunctional nicotinamidase/pyrazinamidase [Paracoccaceae bacterium]